MANNQPPQVFTDEELHSFLTGNSDSDLSNSIEAALESDPALAERLATLDDLPGIGPAVATAFDTMLEAAPKERLESILNNALIAGGAQASAPRAPAAPEAAAPFWQDLARLFRLESAAAMALGLVMFLGVGFVIGRTTVEPQIVEVMVPAPPAPGTQTPVAEGPAAAEAPKTPGWLVAVADYFKLFTADTYASAQVDDAARLRSLEFVSERIALDIGKAPQVAGLSLQRAELLDLKGKPLAQIGYVDGQGRPIAVCIIYRGPGMVPAEAPPPPTYKQDGVHDFNIVHWNVQPHGFLIIGDVPADELEALAREVHETLI